MNSPAAVREFFKTVLQQMCHMKADVIAGDANAAAAQVPQKTRVPRSARFLSCRHASGEMQREVNTGRPF